MDNTLVPLIKRYLAQGYDITTVRNSLLRYGYSSEIIDKAINEVYKKHGISKNTIIIIVAVFILIVLLGSAFFVYSTFNKTPSPQPIRLPQITNTDITLSGFSLAPIDADAQPGEEIVFVTKISNPESAKGFDVELRYDVISANTGEVATFKEETRQAEALGTQTSITIPANIEPGNYILKATAKYQGKEAKAAMPVKIYLESTEATCFDNIKNQDETDVDCGGVCEPCKAINRCPITCDDGDKCTNDYCDEATRFECVHEKIKGCCGNKICEDGEDFRTCAIDCNKPVDTSSEFNGLNSFEILDKIKEIAETDPDKAATYCESLAYADMRDDCFLNIGDVSASRLACEKIADERKADICFSKVAKAKQDSTICSEISRENVKDSCYMNFVIDFKDYSVCDKISNSYLKDSCDSLKKISEMG